jgi:enoyl-CoA hydratase/carnithine racemase
MDEKMTVELSIDDNVGVVTLAKPPHNLIDPALLEGLIDAYSGAARRGCRAILLRSSMRSFCAGADIVAFTKGFRISNQQLYELFDTLENVDLPTVAAVNGAALGGGVELALTCDVIVAADTATFGMVESSIGIMPLLGGTQRVVQRAGLARGKELTMVARRHDSRTMERYGVINFVTPEVELGAVSMALARQLAAGPTVALKGIKRLANISAREGIAAADERQTEASELMWASKDARRGLDAFLTSGPGTGVFQGD